MYASYDSLTSPQLFKHQVELVFLFKELYQLQDVTVGRRPSHSYIFMRLVILVGHYKPNVVDVYLWPWHW